MSWMDLKKTVAAASYIEERRNNDLFLCEEDERSEERFLEWQKLLNVVPDKDIFGIRLEKDGISKAEAMAICGSVACVPEAELPEWAKIIEGTLKLLPTEESEIWERISLKREEIKLVGPISALAPFVLYAENRLKEQYADLPLATLSDILLHRLYYTCSQTFNARARRMVLYGQVSPGEGDAVWEKMGAELIGGAWAELFEEYPVLAKRIGITIQNYLNFIEEFLTRFYEKKTLLEQTFFGGEPIEMIESIEGEISDLHQGGKSVLILKFDDNRKLVYKPRSLEIDVAWEQFLAHFAAGKTSIKAPRALDFGHFGFIEHIEHKPCASEAEVAEYFYNAGALMALLYGFAGNDFHMENIIARGKTPVLIDTETLMIPVARPFAQGGEDLPKETEESENTLENMIENSVLKTGFLPFWQKDSSDKRVDYGGLTGDKEDMKNLPVFNGKKYPGNAYGTEIQNGFDDMYELLLEKRDELLHGEKGLKLFYNCKFRMLIRSSQVYGNVLQHITQPAFLSDGFAYSLKTERMVNAFLYEAAESIIPDVLRVFKAERDAVLRGDLPIFYCEPHGEGILDETGLLFDRYFGTSAIANAEKRIAELSQANKKVQMQIIGKSMATEVRNVHEYVEEHGEDAADENGQKRTMSREELVAEAKAIYGEIMDNRFVAQNGEYSWLAEQYDLQRGGTALNVMGPALYDGLLGIALFFGALYEVTGDESAKEAAEACVKKAWTYLESFLPNMERYQMPIGFSSGTAGYLTGLLLLSRYLKNEEIFANAIKLVNAITPSMIKRDANLDVLGGVSGIVLALTKDERLLQNGETGEHVRLLLQACGEHLLAQKKSSAVEGYTLWEIKECTKPLTGLGHGVAGIADALFRLYEVFGEERFLEAGREAIAYENSVFDESAGNWPDFRRDPDEKDPNRKKFMAGYCAGAPGIGIARLDYCKRLPEKTIAELNLKKDIEKAENLIRSMKAEGRNHLCCGSAGRIDFLIEEAVALDNSGAMELALEKMSTLIFSKNRSGHYNFHVTNGKYYYNPTLFQGTAGVGYEILRLLEPEKVVSILI